MRVLSPEQDLLTDYLAALGMSVIKRLIILTQLWEPKATMEMLRYIADTEESNPETLLRVSAEIARKYPDNCEEEGEA